MIAQRRTAGVAVADAGASIGLSRSGSSAARAPAPPAEAPTDCPADQALRERIRMIQAQQPFWGYRRVWAWVRDREPRQMNKKRVSRLMRDHD